MVKTNFDEEKLAGLWKEYKASPSESLRATLVNTYAPIVKNIVLSFIHKKPNILDYDDLYQAGQMGLLDAIEKFDPERGILFQTYASIRVRGSILDEINGMDWTPRSIRENIRGVLKSIEGHYQDNQSAPSIADISERTQFDRDKTRLVMNQMDRTHMVHVEQEILDIVGPVTDEAHVEREAAIKYVMDTMLTEEERRFVRLKFFEGYSNKEIMVLLRLNPSMFRMLKDSSTSKLMQGLQGYETDF